MSDQSTDYLVKLAEMANETVRCKRCGHKICPHCGDWCDTIAMTEEDVRERGIIVIDHDPNSMVILCCDGECVIDRTPKESSE